MESQVVMRLGDESEHQHGFDPTLHPKLIRTCAAFRTPSVVATRAMRSNN
jgi:hypothetical protein